MNAEEPTPIYQLIYSSAAAREMRSEELEGILAAARRNNSALGITGMLLYHEGSFLQVLEGKRELVEELFSRIEKDDRHTAAMVLLRSELPERAFEGWSMGFYRARSEDLRTLAGRSDFLRTGVVRTTDEEHGEKARRILLAFREGRWRRRVATQAA